VPPLAVAVAVPSEPPKQLTAVDVADIDGTGLKGAEKEYAELAPHELLALTVTVPAAVPAVRLIVLVVLVPLQPVPETVHVYEVAPLTAGTVYDAMTPGHGAVAGNVTEAGAAGTEPIGAENEYAELDPHELFAFTVMVPATVPAVRVILLVVLVPLQPVPLTVHVYDVAPDTAGTVYAAVEAGHGAVGSVTDAGAAGAPVLIGAENEYAELDPHELLAFTVIVPAEVPAVSVMLLVVLVPLQPVPDTVHVYEVAPDTAGVV
jgi:hypothetical protein